VNKVYFMSDYKLDPQKVTRPIQLLAAWLVGLTVINGSFLGAAVSLGAGQWERSALVIAAIVNVPLFLIALFILQTRFRAELQEDPFYFQYISRKTDTAVSISKVDVQDAKIEVLRQEISLLRAQPNRHEEAPPDWSDWLIALNDYRDDFVAIRSALEQAHIPVNVIFGKSDGARHPGNWVISINEAIGFRHTIALLKVLTQFHFDGFQFWEPVRDAGEEEDIYIGAYGVKKYIRITDELSSLLSKEPDQIEFKYYISKNQKR